MWPLIANTRTGSYDSLGRKTSETFPESGTASYVYDDNGNVTQKTDARGLVTGYFYDALNRLVKRSHSDSTLWSLFTYNETGSSLIGLITNGKGRMTSVWTVNSSLQHTTESTGYSWSFDVAGRVLQQTASIDGTSYTQYYSYTDSGCGCSKADLQSINYPLGKQVSYSHDTNERVIGIADSDGIGYAGIQYGLPNGGISQIQYHAGTDTFSLDNAGRLATIDYSFPYSVYPYLPGNSDDTYTYTYTPAGRISQISGIKTATYGGGWLHDTLSSLNHSLSYDRPGRLTTENWVSYDYFTYSGNSWGSSWSYDRYGNAAGVANSSNNRLTAFAGNYDNAGNLLQDTNNGYSFNAENRTTQAIRRSDGAQLGAYRYDALDRKVKVSWNLGANNYGSYVYIYGTHNEILQENKNSFDGTNLYVLSTMNVYMGTTMVGKRTIGTISYATQVDTIQWLHRNHRQEVIYTETLDHTDPNWYITGATIGGPYQSGAFSGGGSDQFPGQKVDDETGLKDFGARYYNSTSMRWTSADSVTAHIYDPQSLNKYTYVRNDPVNLVDPDGYSPCGSSWHARYDLSGTLIGFYEGPGATDPTLGDLINSNDDTGLLGRVVYAESDWGQWNAPGSLDNINEKDAIALSIENRVDILDGRIKIQGVSGVSSLGWGPAGASLGARPRISDFC